jgi:hypothetical protein
MALPIIGERNVLMGSRSVRREPPPKWPQGVKGQTGSQSLPGIAGIQGTMKAETVRVGETDVPICTPETDPSGFFTMSIFKLDCKLSKQFELAVNTNTDVMFIGIKGIKGIKDLENYSIRIKHHEENNYIVVFELGDEDNPDCGIYTEIVELKNIVRRITWFVDSL